MTRESAKAARPGRDGGLQEEHDQLGEQIDKKSNTRSSLPAQEKKGDLHLFGDMSGPKGRTPIAALVESLLASGVAHDAIVHAVEAAEHHTQQTKKGSKSAPIVVASRGTRLMETWRPNIRGLEYAAERGLDGSRLETEIERFRNYWTAKSGAGATKVDWEATWRNWILNAMERGNVPVRSTRANGATSHPPTGHSATGNDATLAGMARIAGRVVKRREQEQRGRTGLDEEGEHRDDAALQLKLEIGGTGSD